MNTLSSIPTVAIAREAIGVINRGGYCESRRYLAAHRDRSCITRTMPVRLFDLRGGPEDEAEEVRALLTNHKIEFYETSAGNWGISVPAIWLHDDTHFEQAKQIIAQYQEERFSKARSEYTQRKREGKNRTIIEVAREDPVRFIVYLVVALFILVLSIKPLVDIGK